MEKLSFYHKALYESKHDAIKQPGWIATLIDKLELAMITEPQHRQRFHFYDHWTFIQQYGHQLVYHLTGKFIETVNKNIGKEFSELTLHYAQHQLLWFLFRIRNQAYKTASLDQRLGKHICTIPVMTKQAKHIMLELVITPYIQSSNYLFTYESVPVEAWDYSAWEGKTYRNFGRGKKLPPGRKIS